MKVAYQIKLIQSEERLDAHVMGTLFDALFQANLRALRLRLEGRSVAVGPVQQWLREAASFELVGLSAGSVVLKLEAAPLGEIVSQRLRALPASFADKPCAALVADSLSAALSREGDPLLYDEGLLETFIALPKIPAPGFAGLVLSLPFAEPWACVELRVEHIEKLRRLQQRLAMSAPQLIELTGVLIYVDVNGRYTLRTDDGVPIDGLAGEALLDELPRMLGERVTVTGTAAKDAHGRMARLLTESIRLATEAPAAAPGAKGRLTRITVHGFKTLRDLEGLTLGRLNVLIGANGAGKSNLLSFFRLLESFAAAAEDGLATYVLGAGGADALLHDGAATTPEIRASFTVETEVESIDYAFRLVSGAPDILLFAEERFRVSPPGSDAPWRSLGAGHRESALRRAPDIAARRLLGLLQSAVAYQFHNTSNTSRMRRRWGVADGLTLKSDAANLGPFLLRLRESRRDAYDRIVETVRQIAPFFADFHLEPAQGTMLLEWRERNTSVVFGPHQASDGTLRMMALVALLLQPYEDLPALIIVDEPELGLHPYAIEIVAGLFRSASHHAQVILATQSTTFLDLFEPEEIIVVDRRDRESHLKRLDPAALAQWLEE